MKYSTFKYGGGAAGAKYGTGIAVELKVWYFGVYWDDAFVDESSRLVGFQLDRGREHLLSTGGSWERYTPGQVDALLDNSDGRFDVYNTASPLYGFLLPGRVVRITVAVTAPYSDVSTTYPVMRGIIDDIRSLGLGRNGRRQARIVVKDGLKWLAERSIQLALVEDDEALLTAAAIATQINFDDVDDWTIAQLGDSSVVVPFVWGNSNRALDLIDELVEAEAGQVFHANDGILTFVTNDYTQASTTEIEESQVLKDLELRQPWEVVRTRAQITVQPFVAGSSAVVWFFGVDDSGVTGTPRLHIDGGVTSISVDAIFDLDGPFASPSVSSIYAELDPPGSDVSSDIDVSMVDIGTGLRLTFERTGAALVGLASDVYIYYVEISASPYERGDAVIISASDAPAIAIYGEKTFELDNPWIQSQEYAQSYADYVVSELKDANPFPIIQIEGRGALQFAPDLYVDKIALSLPTLGIDDTFRIGKISHQWLSENGIAVRTRFYLEPVLGALE